MVKDKFFTNPFAISWKAKLSKNKVVEDVCEHCGGTGEVSCMEAVYPGEAPMAMVGTRKCECQYE